MPKHSNQKLKILYLIDLLLHHTDQDHPLSMKDIIAALEAKSISAERKSLYDDIEALRLYGYDVQIVKGGTVGYFIGSRNFELAELKLLVDSVQASKFITVKKSNALIKKLESLASEYEARSLQRQVYVNNRIKTMNESIYYNVDILHTAIAENSRISFKYYEWNIHKEKQLRHNGRIYNVSPLAMTWDSENYYLIGYDSCADKIKHYRVDKMQKIEILKMPRDGQELLSDADFAVYSNKVFSMFGGPEENICLLCDNSIVGAIIDRFGTDIFIVPEGDHFRISLNVIISPLFISWILGFGNRISVISPDSIRRMVVSHCISVLEGYGIDSSSLNPRN